MGVLQQSFRRMYGLGAGGETGDDNRLLEETLTRIGANVMGKRMFTEGEHNWPEEAPFHSPVYVLTNQQREPWERKGGTTFYFVNDGIESALQQARRAAGNKDVRISGGAAVINEFINAGHVDELTLHVAPLLLGRGVRLFNGADAAKFSLEPISAAHSPHVTHVRYAVTRR